MQNCVGSYDDTRIQYCEFFLVCCNFIFHVIHIKQDYYYVFTFSFCSQILLPSPDPSITWVVSTQADISERSRSFLGHLYYPVQVPVAWRENRPIHHLYSWPALPKQYIVYTVYGYLQCICKSACTVIQYTVNEESMCFPTGWWQLGYKLRMYSWKLCLKSFLLIKIHCKSFNCWALFLKNIFLQHSNCLSLVECK